MASAVCAQILLPVASAAKVAQPTRVNGLARVQLEKAASNTWAQRTVSNGVTTRAMLVWEPTDNKYFETFSYLPPLTSDQIAKQIDYIVNNGWVPCLEFSEPENAYVANHSCERFGNGVAAGFYDNRYWTMFKLPMFGCTDPGQVLSEVDNCTKCFPTAYVRLTAFDNVRQVQICSFLVHRPENATDHRPIEERSR